MTEHCEIAELLGDAADCPVCRASSTSLVLDAWDELRAVTAAVEPEPLVLLIPA